MEALRAHREERREQWRRAERARAGEAARTEGEARGEAEGEREGTRRVEVAKGNGVGETRVAFATGAISVGEDHLGRLEAGMGDYGALWELLSYDDDMHVRMTTT